MKSAAAVILIIVATIPTAGAQAGAVQAEAAPSAAATLLASAKTLRCVFPVSVRTTWKDGVPQPAARRPGNFIINIRDIKSDAGSAVLAAGVGGKDITLVTAEQNRYFLDAGGGRVALTAVLGEFSTASKLKASHSVSDFTSIEVGSFRSEPDIVHYGGDCEVVP